MSRYGERPVITAGALALAAGFALLPFAGPEGAGRMALLLGGVVVLTIGFSLATPALAAHLSRVSADDRQGRALGALQSVSAMARIVGPPLAGVELRIAEDGEILVRGGLVMDGYWNQPETTADTIRDGWLHTGDVGALDARGCLTITDRKRDIIVLSGGENVSPARLEGMLVAEPEIAQAVVHGDGQSGLSALLVPADDADAGTVAAAVARFNGRVSVTERVRRHALVPPFTIENGLLTPSQKVRRAAALRMHRGAA